MALGDKWKVTNIKHDSWPGKWFLVGETKSQEVLSLVCSRGMRQWQSCDIRWSVLPPNTENSGSADVTGRCLECVSDMALCVACFSQVQFSVFIYYFSWVNTKLTFSFLGLLPNVSNWSKYIFDNKIIGLFYQNIGLLYSMHLCCIPPWLHCTLLGFSRSCLVQC